MTNEEKVKEIMEECNTEHLTDFLDSYFGDDEEILDFLRGNEWGDRVHEYTDGAVSCYTSDRYEWASENAWGIAQHECDSGATRVEDIIAYCWYMTVYEELTEGLARAKEGLEEIEAGEEQLTNRSGAAYAHENGT